MGMSAPQARLQCTQVLSSTSHNEPDNTSRLIIMLRQALDTLKLPLLEIENWGTLLAHKKNRLR